MTPLGPQETRVQARSREGRWCWTLTKSWTTICGSRRDPEEGGELDFHGELDYHFESRRDQKGGGARHTRELRIDQEQGGGAGLRKLDRPLLQLFFNGCATDIVFVTAPHSSSNSS